MPEEFVNDIIVADSSAETSDIPAAAAPVETPTPETPAEDPVLADVATQLGWKPNHTGENYVDAKTYILRSKDIQDSMRDHNKDLKNQLQTIQGSVDVLKEHNERVYKADVTRMQGEIDRLRKEKKAAIEMADVDKVDALEKEIGTIEKTLSVPQPRPAPTTNPVYDEWVQSNEWYLNNNEMATYADTVAQQYAGAPLARLYPLVRAKVAEVFPDYFEQVSGKPGNPAPGNPVLAKPIGPASPVEAGRNQSAAKSFTKADLTPDQLSIMNQFVKGGIMTENQYISDIAKLQEA